MLQGIGTTEILIILLILVAVFGSKKILELARGAGEATKELKNIKQDYETAVKEVTDVDSLFEGESKGGD